VALGNTLAEQIASQLRRDILRGKLPPGASVKERDNATAMGVSRTPLREAIRILSKEGLIELRTARSPIVSSPSVKQISDEVEVLLSVEILSGELACGRATDAEIDGLEKIVDRMAEEFDTADPIDMFEIDMSFHSALAKASHNDALAEIHRTFLARLWRARFLAAVQRRNRERVIDHHSMIVDAMRARDAKQIRKTIQLHLGNLKEDIVRVMQQEADSQADASSKSA